MFNRKSSYALNKKDPNAIVYMDANEAIIRLTREDFASEEEFLKWKSLSDADYHASEKEDHVYLRLSRHLRIELNHRRSYRRTCLLHRAAARCHSYHPRNHLNYIVNEEGLFLLQFGVRSKPSFFVAQKPEYLLAIRRRKGVFKHETHDSR